METLRLDTLILVARWTIAVAATAMPTVAQPTAPKFSPASVIDATGVVPVGDRVLGLGPGYRLVFHRDGVDMGGRNRMPSLSWRVESIGRRNFMSPSTAGTPRVDAERRVVYDRRSVCETYELRDDGVEQSFTFTTLPEGNGDLVVRLRLETDLCADSEDAVVDRLVFASSSGDGISIGGVMGIDATGLVMPGAMRFHEDILELVLPSQSVDAAVLPLVLDPLIGSQFSTGYRGGTIRGSGVAYDATNDVFLVAWTEGGGVTISTDALGRLVRPDGSLVGSLLCLECGPADTAVGGMANVNLRDRFMVWIGFGSPVTVDAASGAVRTATTLPALGLFPYNSDLSGEATVTSDRVIGIRLDIAQLTVLAEQFQVAIDGSLISTKSLVLAPATAFPSQTTVSIAQNGGLVGRTLAVWDHQSQIHSVVFDRDMTILDQRVIAASGAPRITPVVDGNGHQWLVAYAATDGVRAVPVFWDDAARVAWTGMERIVAGPGYRVFDVTWVGESYLVEVGAVGQPFSVISVDPFTCNSCEGSFRIRNTVYAIASQRGGDPTTGDVALLSTAAGFSQLYRADDGITTDLGGGCGQGGWSAATCARVGNDGFTVRLRAARPSAPALLVLGTQPLAFACGSCTLLVSPLTVVGAGLTDSHGNAEVLLPVPNQPSLVNQAFLEQWVTVGGTACSLGIELSNGLRVQLQ